MGKIILDVKKLLAKISNNPKECINKYMSEAWKLTQDLDKEASNIQRKVNNMYGTQRQDGEDISVEEKLSSSGKFRISKQIGLLEIKISIILKLQ